MNECIAKETTRIIVIGAKFNKLFCHLWNKSVPLDVFTNEDHSQTRVARLLVW